MQRIPELDLCSEPRVPMNSTGPLPADPSAFAGPQPAEAYEPMDETQFTLDTYIQVGTRPALLCAH